MSSLSRFFQRPAGCPCAAGPVSGLLLALSFPKADLPFLAWIALIPLLIALEGQSPRTAFLLGFLSGLASYGGLIYWVTIVMTDYGHLPLLVSIPLWLLLSCWLALFTGVASWAAVLGERLGVKAALLFPMAWVAPTICVVCF